jgi:outer membrane protein OmpA-like peptidoglycan-associated protein
MRILVLIFFFCPLSITYCQTGEEGRRIVKGISSDKYTEFSPTISADGRTIIFESSVNEEKGWELFESQMNDKGEWIDPVPLKTINEKCDFLAGPSLSYDGNTLYYTAFIEGTSVSEDIYFSQRTGSNSWGEPIRMSAPINTDEQYEGFPSISSDGTTLYFIRQNPENNFDKKNKESCFKILFSKMQPDGQWSEPVALPPVINSGCERDPKIMADNHTLIFSSIRKGGLGKFDMYQTVKQRDGSWSEPTSLYFVNSPDNDQSPCISASGELMYFYSVKDIFSTPIPIRFRQMMNVVVQGRVLDGKTSEPVNSFIHVSDLKTGENHTVENSGADGEYSLVLNAGSNYSVVFDNEEFLPDTLTINLETQKTYELLRKNIMLRSSFPLKVKVVDKDIDTPIVAWLDMNQDSQHVFQDSIKSSEPLLLTLNALDLKINAKKARYMPFYKEEDFKDFRLRKNKDLIIKLEHEKVKFTSHVTNVSTKQRATVKVYYKDQNVEELLIGNSGESVSLRKGDRYQIVTSSEEGYFFSTATIVAGENDSVHLLIVPIEINSLLTLNNITFATNSAELLKTSQFELDRVMELMQMNPGLVVEISAHSDDVGEENFNLKLSEKRAQSALVYLTKKGISKERLVAVGRGESKPVVPNDSDANRNLNRRVELRILKINATTK